MKQDERTGKDVIEIMSSECLPYRLQYTWNVDGADYSVGVIRQTSNAITHLQCQ